MRKENRQRLATEFRYAVTKMQEAKQPAKKLFYFSAIFGEAQRVLNFEWDRDLVLIWTVTQFIHTQVTNTIQAGALGLFPIDIAIVCDKLTQSASDIAAYYENPDSDTKKEQLYKTLGCMSEAAYTALGNGSYLYEKGLIKL